LGACYIKLDRCFFTFSEATRLNSPYLVKIEIAPLSVSEKPACVLSDFDSSLVLTEIDIAIAAS
jgi:hypothetical protein